MWRGPSFSYSPASGHTSSGPGSHQALTVTFTPTDGTDYAGASDTVYINVNQATPTISWATPAAITYGTALGGTQLDATANVQGSFSYSPASGTVLGAGSHQALTVTFTPTDGTDYAGASDTVYINVNQATPTIGLGHDPGHAITYGTARWAAMACNWTRRPMCRVRSATVPLRARSSGPAVIRR